MRAGLPIGNLTSQFWANVYLNGLDHYIKRNKVIHARRRLKTRCQEYETGEITLQQAIASVRSWVAHAAHGDTWGLRGAVLEEIVLR